MSDEEYKGPDPLQPVRVMLMFPKLPVLNYEKVPCTSLTGHHWDNQGRCHTCGIPHPDTQTFMLCTSDHEHGRATTWCWEPQLSAYVALCEKCKVNVEAYNKRAAAIKKALNESSRAARQKLN